MDGPMSLENVLMARFSIEGLFVEIIREINQFLKFYTCENGLLSPQADVNKARGNKNLR